MKGVVMKIMGYLLIAVGVAALLNVVWPVIIIGLGLAILAHSVSARTWNKKVDSVKEKSTNWKKDGVWLRLSWPTLHRAETQESSESTGPAEAAGTGAAAEPKENGDDREGAQDPA